MKRRILIALALAAVAVSGAVIWFGSVGKTGTVAVICRDGRELYRLPLVQEREITVPSADGGKNVIRVSPQGICVVQADCPDLLCQKQGTVTEAGVPIVCLPHRLTVRIERGEDK